LSATNTNYNDNLLGLFILLILLDSWYMLWVSMVSYPKWWFFYWNDKEWCS